MRLQSTALLFSALLVAVLVPPAVTAQTATSGGLTGVITDQTGAVVVNADVEIKESSKGSTQSTKTDRDGVYRFFFLAPDRYLLTIIAPGFEPTRGIATISVGQTSSLDFTLKIGATSTTVEVTTGAPIVENENSGVATVIDASQIADLPNPGNDLTSVAQTVPGAVMNTQKTGMGGTGNFSTYGLPATSNLFTLDGMDENDPLFNVNIAGATGLTLGLKKSRKRRSSTTGIPVIWPLCRSERELSHQVRSQRLPRKRTLLVERPRSGCKRLVQQRRSLRHACNPSTF